MQTEKAVPEPGKGDRTLQHYCSTIVWFTLVTGTMSFCIPRSVLVVLDVGQHQSNALLGRFVVNSPLQSMAPSSLCA
jgi:aconitase B